MSFSSAFYELTTVLVYVSDDKRGGNMVAEIKMTATGVSLDSHGGGFDPLSERDRGTVFPPEQSGTMWFVFNDFAVSPLTAAEALHFNTTWKIPCLLYYTRVGLREKYPRDPRPRQISPKVLLDDSEYCERLLRRV